MTEQLTNAAQTTLSSLVSAMATTLPLTASTGFPASGTYRVLIDQEIVAVSSRSGSNLTVTRGIEGTTAASHASGATVTLILTAGALSQMKADILEQAAISATTTFESPTITSNASLPSGYRSLSVPVDTSGGPVALIMPSAAARGDEVDFTDVGLLIDGTNSLALSDANGYPLQDPEQPLLFHMTYTSTDSRALGWKLRYNAGFFVLDPNAMSPTLITDHYFWAVK